MGNADPSTTECEETFGCSLRFSSFLEEITGGESCECSSPRCSAKVKTGMVVNPGSEIDDRSRPLSVTERVLRGRA